MTSFLLRWEKKGSQRRSRHLLLPDQSADKFCTDVYCSPSFKMVSDDASVKNTGPHILMLTPGLCSRSLFSASSPPPLLLHYTYHVLVYGEISGLQVQTILYQFPHFLLPFTAEYRERTFMPSLPVPSSFSLIPIKVLSHPLLKFVLVSITGDWLPHGQVRCWVAGLGNISLLGFWAGTLWCFSSLTSYSFLVSFDDLPNLCTWECSKAWSLTLFSAFFRSLGDLIQSQGSKRHLWADVRLLFLLSPRFQTCGYYCLQESCAWISNTRLILYTYTGALSSSSSCLCLLSLILDIFHLCIKSVQLLALLWLLFSSEPLPHLCSAAASCLVSLLFSSPHSTGKEFARFLLTTFPSIHWVPAILTSWRLPSHTNRVSAFCLEGSSLRYLHGFPAFCDHLCTTQFLRLSVPSLSSFLHSSWHHVTLSAHLLSVKNISFVAVFTAGFLQAARMPPSAQCVLIKYLLSKLNMLNNHPLFS